MGVSLPPTRDLSALLPEVADSAQSLQAAAAAAGVHLTPTETRRSQARQESLYAQGRTAPGKVVTWTLHSNHTPGAAVDFVVNGDPSGKDPGYQWLQQNAGKFGFGVLGPKDPGHVEMPGAVDRYASSRPVQPLPVQRVSASRPQPRLAPPQLIQAMRSPGPSLGAASAAELPPEPSPQQPSQPTGGPSAVDPVADYLTAKQQQQSLLSDPVAEYLAAKHGTGSDIHAEYTSGRLAKRMQRENANEREATDAETPSYAGQALGGIASLARDIPGAEVLQSGARALARGQSYADARNDIRGAEESAPAVVRNMNRTIGGVVAAAASPVKSPALSGATFGVADALAQSDPNAGVGERVKDAAVEGTIGAATGKLGDAATNGVRALMAKRLGTNVVDRKTAMLAADATNYGRSAAEGTAAGGSHPAITAAFNDPDIKPFADMVRGARQFAGADDATVAREAFKQMTKQEGGLTRRLAENGYDAATQLQLDNIRLAKGELRKAAAQIMPSLPGAIDTHATAAGNIDALKTGSRATKPLLSGKQVPEKSLGTKKDPEGFLRSIPGMTPEEAQAALEGVFGRTKDSMHGSANLLKLFGVPGSLAKAGKITPFVRPLENQAGGAPVSVDAVRALVASRGYPSP